MSKPALTIDVISDVVCPWCFIGKRRLTRALELYREAHPEATEPEVRWWPFQLNPDMPAEGIDRSAYLAKKFGTANVSDIYARVTAAGADVGIPFAFDKMVKQPNTLVAHSLVAQAGLHGLQEPMLEALFTAYFLRGEDLTQAATLERIATAVGLPNAAIRECLDGTELRTQTAHEDARARELGVSGVPFFIFNRRLAVSGAQPEEMLLQAMEQALGEPVAANA